MSTISGASLSVLKSFINGANAQYREAGLGEYQMRVDGGGRVTTPNAPAAGSRTPSATGTASAEQATAGAAAAAAPASSAAPAAEAAASTGPAAAAPAGAAPKIVDLQQGADGAFTLKWEAVEGAKQYGVYQDGKLLGHVPSPAFAGKLATSTGGTIQFDAVRADGTRTPQTPALVVARSKDGKLSFEVPGAQAAAATAAAAPAP
ncbi:MAG: hypothetical protein JWM90_2619 [Thermoleophilia bacterium]|nr:hypothetical protein [Thermoleophilia bacterium]